MYYIDVYLPDICLNSSNSRSPYPTTTLSCCVPPSTAFAWKSYDPHIVDPPRLPRALTSAASHRHIVFTFSPTGQTTFRQCRRDLCMPTTSWYTHQYPSIPSQQKMLVNLTQLKPGCHRPTVALIVTVGPVVPDALACPCAQMSHCCHPIVTQYGRKLNIESARLLFVVFLCMSTVLVRLLLTPPILFISFIHVDNLSWRLGSSRFFTTVS